MNVIRDPYLRRASLRSILNAVSDDALYCPTGRTAVDGRVVAGSGFLFLGVPGAADTVVVRALQSGLGDPSAGAIETVRLGDVPDKDIILSSEAAFGDLWRFTVVRNPYARLVALWRRSLAPDAPAPDPSILTDHPALGGGITFEAFCDHVTSLQGSDAMAHPSWKSQHLFLTNRNGHSVVHFTGNWDNLATDFRRAADWLGLAQVDIRMDGDAGGENWSGPDDPADWRDFYSSALRKDIADRYAIDLRVLPFEF